MFSIRPYNRRRGVVRGEDFFPAMQWPQYLQEFFEGTGMNAAGFRVDIQDKDQAYVLEAELPGIDKDNIHVDIHEDTLTIKVEHDHVDEERQENYLRRERRFNRCQRSFFIGDVDHESIDAQYKDGILRITLPKTQQEARRQRQIDIH